MSILGLINQNTLTACYENRIQARKSIEIAKAKTMTLYYGWPIGIAENAAHDRPKTLHTRTVAFLGFVQLH
jgi:hypothetical protein